MATIDPENPFIALGVSTRELSYSQVIARRLFTDPAYLARLSARLGLSTPLTFGPDDVRTEMPLPGAGRLDILAREPGGRTVVVEMKVKAQVDLEQQARYVAAGRAAYGPDTIFLAYKLGPAVLPACVPGFRALTSADVLADLPPGDHMGLRSMLEVFAAIASRLAQDPLAPRRRVAAGAGDALDQFLLGALGHSFYDYLFDAFRGKVSDLLSREGLETRFEITSRGGAILQFYQPAWVNTARGVQVHFELLAGERVALHVETEPYDPGKAEPWQLANKTALARGLHAAVGALGVPRLQMKGLRKKVDRDCSTTIATLPISFDDLDRSAADFAAAYRLCAPVVAQAF